jgi:hypothetical protein
MTPVPMAQQLAIDEVFPARLTPKANLTSIDRKV